LAALEIGALIVWILIVLGAAFALPTGAILGLLLLCVLTPIAWELRRRQRRRAAR